MVHSVQNDESDISVQSDALLYAICAMRLYSAFRIPKLLSFASDYIFGFYYASFVNMLTILRSPDDSGANASGAKRFGR